MENIRLRNCKTTKRLGSSCRGESQTGKHLYHLLTGTLHEKFTSGWLGLGCGVGGGNSSRVRGMVINGHDQWGLYPWSFDPSREYRISKDFSKFDRLEFGIPNGKVEEEYLWC